MNHSHHHPHLALPHAGVAIGPLPNHCIGMVAAPTPGGPVIAGIGVPIMTAAPTLVPPPPQAQALRHQHPAKKGVMSPDSTDDQEKCGVHAFIQRTSPTGINVVSCSGAPRTSELNWSSAQPQSPSCSIIPAGIAYPVMGISTGALPGEGTGNAAGMIYGVPIGEQQVPAGVNSVLALSQSSSPALVGAVQAPATAISITPIMHTQTTPSTTVSNHTQVISGTTAQQKQSFHQQQAKEIIHCKFCTLFPPNPNAPPPTTREKPPGCRTAFVGGLPENIREDIVREIFERCGEITTIRMSKKNFCHIRFESEKFVELALYFSGYRIRIGSNTDSANVGRLHVDYAQARDDLYEWECRQRQLLREQRHRERLEQERLHPLSPPPTIHFSDHEAANVAERIKGDDTFMKAIQSLYTWLEKGECVKRNSSTFYSMIQSTNSQIRRLMNEKSQFEDEFHRAKDVMTQRMTGLLFQFSQIEKVFSAACQRKVWDHFSKAQRKNIEVWKKQAQEIKNALLEEALNERADEEMELSDMESDSSGMSNKENGEPPRAKKMRLIGEEVKTVHKLKEENDALRCQLEASKNEVDLIKADLRSELDLKDQQLKILQQQILDIQGGSGCSSNILLTSTFPSYSTGVVDSIMSSMPSGNNNSEIFSPAEGVLLKQKLHSTSSSVSSSSNPSRFEILQTRSNNETEAAAENTTFSFQTSDKGFNMAQNRCIPECQEFCDSSSSTGISTNNMSLLQQQLPPQCHLHIRNEVEASGSVDEKNCHDVVLVCEDPAVCVNKNNRTKSRNGNETSSDQTIGTIGISEKEGRLLGIISTFLHVHPFGASLDYIWSYAQKVLPALRPNQIEVLMTKFPILFKQEISGVGATLERKWVFVGFNS